MFIVSANTTHYESATPESLVNACGLIPMFFRDASNSLKGPEGHPEAPLSALADAMDAIYQFGGFSYPMDGKVDDNGVYVSPYDGDEPLHPYVTLYNRGFICHIYPYAIVAIEGTDGETKIARMD